jgi:hypothetical protein
MSKFDDKFKLLMESLLIKEDNETLEYPDIFKDDPELDKKYYASPEIKEEIDKLANMLLERGFKEVKFRGSDRNIRSFVLPNEGYKVAYYGDFRNYSGKLAPVFEKSSKELQIGEVFKHNGAAANASIEIMFSVYNGKPRQVFMMKDWKTGEEYESVSINCMGNNARFKKFKPGLTDKARMKLIDGAIAEYNKIPLIDVTEFDVLKNK